ncbi:MAG: alpha-amylase [Ruminococcaceae bacterium]|nr:alpha-amylase [Oscillospiraceae bacterium]
MKKRTILQNFEWYLPADAGHWHRTALQAERLAGLGFTDVWLPPAYKGNGGIEDVGYGVYDLYDLGEFDQKDTIPTKYGTREEYCRAIDTLHHFGLEVLADIVLNHRMGADYAEYVRSHVYDPSDRLRRLVENKRIKAWTGFKFPGRRQRYSNFKWNHRHFSGVDWNGLTQTNAVYKLAGHRWSKKVDTENANYDYLMGADVDFSVPEVREELEKWGKWYIDTAKIDGVRLDAVKHISYAFFPEWLAAMRAYTGREFFAVGEYWKDDLAALLGYLDNCGRCMSLFDVPLHRRFQLAAEAGASYDLRTILDDTLLSRNPEHTVTFVDNHDTQPGQALQSWVGECFKPLAYALILLRQAGTPCVFYGDLYGIPHDGIGPVGALEKLLLARKEYAHGEQVDYFDHPNVIAWSRGEAMAVVMSNGGDGWKTMHLGKPGQVFIDLLGNRTEEVTVRSDGWADFTVNAGSVSVWVPKEN